MERETKIFPDVEIWKPVRDFEDLYEVSNLARVRSTEITQERISKNGCFYIYHRRMKLLSYFTTNNGYIAVHLYKDSKLFNKSLHRLVAEAFVPNPDNLPEINHKDENKANNLPSNLEWCNRSYNINYGTGRIRAAAKMRGKTISEEHKKKISIANSGANNGMYGKPSWNKGQKGLQTAWNKGVPRSEETKRKISETKRKRDAS